MHAALAFLNGAGRRRPKSRKAAAKFLALVNLLCTGRHPSSEHPPAPARLKTKHETASNPSTLPQNQA